MSLDVFERWKGGGEMALDVNGSKVAGLGVTVA